MVCVEVVGISVEGDEQDGGGVKPLRGCQGYARLEWASSR